jgi:serine/threonine-protein kinase
MGSEAIAGIGVGSVLAGTYEVTGLIGKGGMGAVWAASHQRLPGKRVAIKVLLGSGPDEQALARFRREAEIASRIGHPNIVEVLDFNTLPDGTPYQVLEFLDGESLAGRLKRGPIPVGITLEMARQIGSALLAAHRAGVVHRDLKPDNIFLCPTDSGGVLHDRVKILDFGISKIRGSQTLQTQESVLIGTPQYMSPEQASGKNQAVDQRTDIFALGAIVYEMLTGRSAFSGDNVVSVIMDVVQGTPAPLATLVPALQPAAIAAVERALAKKPDDRFQNVGDFIAALTGRPVQTLGAAGAGMAAVNTASGAGTQRPPSSAGAGRPLSAEEVMGATMAPAPAPITEAPPPVAVTATAHRAAGPAGPTLTADARPAGKSRAGLLIGGVVVATAVAAAVMGGMRARSAGEATEGRQAAAPPVAPVPAAPVPAAPEPAPAPKTPERTAEPPAPKTPEPTAEPDERDNRRPGHPGRKHKDPEEGGRAHDENIPAEAAEHLTEAERSLGRGDAGEAIRRARQSFFIKKTTRGWALLTIAFCHKGDLENAKASFRNLPRGPERARAVRACKAKDIDLE